LANRISGLSSPTLWAQKINVHPALGDLFPRAAKLDPGSVDLCLAAHASVDDVIRMLNSIGVPIEQGQSFKMGLWAAV